MIVNGNWVEALERSDLADSWLLGDGHFETIRTYSNRPFALDRHLERLRSARLASELADVDVELIGSSVSKLLEREPLESGKLRIIVGSDGNWIATHDSYSPPSGTVRCQIVNVAVRGEMIGKQTSYGERFAIRRSAESAGFDDAILSRGSRIISEATTCNLIARVNGAWLTPNLDSGCLAGVTRSFLIESFGVKEAEVSRAELATAESVALTSSLREIQVVESIDGILLPSSNALTRLAADFHSWILGNLAP